MNNIILVGMPSCGKSTLGRMLAKELNYAFIDTEEVISRQNGCPLRSSTKHTRHEPFEHSPWLNAHKDGISYPQAFAASRMVKLSST